MDKVSMAVGAAFLITGPRVQYRAVGQHGAPLVRNVEDIPVTFLALLILERDIGLFAVFFVVVFILDEMDHDVLYPVCRFGVEEIEGVVGSREVAIHAVSHKPLGVVHMGGSLPGVVGKLDFVT
jgi:hypothetical protein